MEIWDGQIANRCNAAGDRNGNPCKVTVAFANIEACEAESTAAYIENCENCAWSTEFY